MGVHMIRVLVSIVLITGCGAYDNRECYTHGEECRKGEAGPEGSAGPEGRQGKPGVPGSDGEPGTDGSNGHDGTAGHNGATGSSGSNGSDGYSVVTATQTIATGDVFCSAGGTRIRLAQDTNRNGVWDTSDLSQQIISVCDGRQGQPGAAGHDGAPGATGAQGSPGEVGPQGPASPSPITILDPCGDAAGTIDEVLVKLADGRILASMSDSSNGQNTRFSVLSTGSYMTTDGSQCYFSIDSNNQIYNQHY